MSSSDQSMSLRDGVESSPPQTALANIEKYKQFRVTYNIAKPHAANNSYDVELKGHFRHTATGTEMSVWGFYAGNNEYKIYFMPVLEGEWTFVTESNAEPNRFGTVTTNNGEVGDSRLHGKTGAFNCISSTLPGRLQVSARQRWKLEETGKVIAPVWLAVGDSFKGEPTSNGQPTGWVKDFIDWAKEDVGARIIGTTLVYFLQNNPSLIQDEIPFVENQQGEAFHLPFWDRLNDKYDYIRDQGMGHYIMFYGDDGDNPSSNGIPADLDLFDGYISKEERFFRYAAARFGSYPMVIFVTGIDAFEYRSESWMDKFTDFFNTNVPYGHFATNRNSGPENDGGGGTYHPSASRYYSDGIKSPPNYVGTNPNKDWILKTYNRDIPTALSDRFRLGDYRFGGGESGEIAWRRVAIWELALLHGPSLYLGDGDVDPNERYAGYFGPNYANWQANTTGFEAAPLIKHRVNFFNNEIQDLNKLDPAMQNLSRAGKAPLEDLLLQGSAVLAAQKGFEYVAYVHEGSTIRIDLSGTEGKSMKQRWFNPLTGSFEAESVFDGDGAITFSPPYTNDWVLHIIVDSDKDSCAVVFGSPQPFKGNSNSLVQKCDKDISLIDEEKAVRFEEIQCDSVAGAYAECSASTISNNEIIAAVELLEQNSSAACTQDVSYGIVNPNQKQMYVDSGCRGRFELKIESP